MVLGKLVPELGNVGIMGDIVHLAERRAKGLELALANGARRLRVPKRWKSDSYGSCVSTFYARANLA